MKSLSLSLFFVFIFSAHLSAQDLKTVAEKMSFVSNLPIPRFIISIPDSTHGISIVYEDIKSITAEKLKQLNKIELVELCFSNQFELDQEIALLPNFPSMKYLVLNDWKFGSKTTSNVIKLPKVLGNYKNIIGLKFRGEWEIDYLDGLATLKELPSLEYLFFQNFKQPIPDTLRGLTQLKGISLESSNFAGFPEWVTALQKLESIKLAMVSYKFKGSDYLNYFDALRKLQKLPLLKNLSLSYFFRSDGDLGTLKFENLENIELYSVDFKANKSLVNFLTHQEKLRSIIIHGSSPQYIDSAFSKLKQLTELSILGRKDSLHINFNLKDLTKLKSLKLSNLNLFLNQSGFPNNLVDLDLSSNDIKVLPNAILKLRKLKTLKLDFDSLTNLPNNFSDLKALEHLNLSNNRLRNLPDNFWNLENLKTLNLISNPIDELAESIGRLSSLEVLDLQNGELKSLPSNIGQLKKLVILNLNDNFIKNIPESLTNLTTLKTLSFFNNQLSALPEEIGKMKSLENLYLGLNNIKHIPVSIVQLRAIKKIDLSFNDLDSLPEEIAGLSSLQELYLNTGKISDFKKNSAVRVLYKKDDPNPIKKITVNQIKNFPEDLSKWISLKKLILNNNSEINNKQLMKGLFTIPSKGFLVELENCGLSFLPDVGWHNFFVRSLNLRNNQIEEIPSGILQAPYLAQINLKKNKLKTSPKDLNEYADNRYEKSLWFTDLGLMEDKELPRTDSMVLALINKSNNHYYQKEFKYAVDLANTALSINDSLAIQKMSLTNIGGANYEVGNYYKAIDYLTRAINQDTAGKLRVLNFVIPDFKFRAKSYIKLGDTLSAINDYRILAEKFNGSWAELGVLYKTIHKSNDANIAFEQGIKKYHEQINFLKNSKQSTEMVQLSLLELMIVQEEFNRAIQYAADLEKEFKSIEHITLLRYLKASAEIGNNSFDIKSKPELLNFILENKKAISGWGYDLFYTWLGITKIQKENEILIRQITDHIKL
ncbi:leucine-rich repeat domain-containing protein [Pedobacter gandavensis]|nr:leucine-rich repeat domain-containing protein [Pedobacter gandavensis]